MRPSRILVCGGRDFRDEQLVYRHLESAAAWFAPSFAIVQGGARGVDKAAQEWALGRGVPCFTAEAPWSTYGNGAGPLRNRWMLDWFSPELVIAFPGGAGTRDMVQQARRRGVIIHTPIPFVYA